MNIPCDCDSYPDCLVLGINDIQDVDNKIVVYPNPTNNLLAVDLREGLLNECTVKVYSLMGVELLYTIHSESLFTIDLSHYSNGLYILEISDEAFSTFKKIQIQK